MPVDSLVQRGDAINRVALGAARWARASPWALAAVVVLVYARSLRGGFLNYDDPWLIQNNPLLHHGGWAALRSIWWGLDDSTRMALGAEYLPVRDSSHWIEARLFALNPHVLRGVNVCLYLGGILILRLYLLRALRESSWLAEAIAWLFALHPVHVESVAWLAGRKDVLVLLFMSLALLLYTTAGRRLIFALPLCAALAMFSKGVAVMLPALLLLHDFLVSRRPRTFLVCLTVCVTALCLAVQVHMGRLVGMVARWPGGSRWTTICTMGSVWCRYLRNAIAPTNLSLVYERPILSISNFAAMAGWAMLASWAVLGIWMWRVRHLRVPLWAFGVFAVGMGPTSQIFVPLQNLMADRYLLIAVLGPLVAAAHIFALVPLRPRLQGALAATAVLTCAGLSAERAGIFSDSVLLWTDTAKKNTTSPLPPYQLAVALQERNNLPGAETAFRQAMERSEAGADEGRMAANNLAILLTKEGRMADAEQMLRMQIARFPDDPKLLGNLAEVVARQGRMEDSRRLFEQLLSRFPSYEQGQQNFRRHFGSSKI